MSDQLDLRIRQMMQRVVDESPAAPDVPTFPLTAKTTRFRMPGWVAALAAAAAVLILVGGTALLSDTTDGGVGEVATVTTTVAAAPVVAPVSGVGDGQTVSVTVSGVVGHTGDHLAGILYEGDQLTDLGDEALGGFWSTLLSNDATTTEVVREPADDGVGRFPFVSDEALMVEPGTYTLVIWVDDGLGPVTRWVPINTDGMGLYGCQTVFEVTNDNQTDIAITPTLQPDGWNTNCATGVAIPYTDSADPVTPPMPSFATSMDPVSGVEDGQTVSITVSDVAGHTGDHLAGVLYEGDRLVDIDGDALGGFWSILSSNDATATEVMREPGNPYVGVFPFVSDEALIVEPGMYTLVIWVDDGLGPATRWVPINTDGMGLFGCQTVFEVTNDNQTNVTITPDLQPDGWDTNCTGP